MIVDLKTGETYGALIYQDTDVCVFWTDGRESLVQAETYGEALQTDAPGWVEFQRFQWTGSHESPPAAQIRAGELARYAAGNGYQILEHREPPPDAPIWARMIQAMRKAGQIPGAGRAE